MIDADANVLWSFEWGHEVKVGDVHCHELGVSCGDYTIEEVFCYQHICRGSCYLIGIASLISTNDKTGSVIFRFFIAYIANKGNIGDILPSGDRDILLYDNFDCVGWIF